MPKRTDAFQSLVARIMSSAQEAGADVKESGSAHEPGSGGDAEIDVLITKTTFGVQLRIAVECRDHRRPQNVQWIRELIGKRSTLKLDAVIAVSRNGFTANARKLAESESIKTMTLHRANGFDFRGAIDRIIVLNRTWELRLTGVTIRLLRPDLPSGTAVDDLGTNAASTILHKDGAPWQTAQDLATAVIGRTDDIRNRFFQELPSIAGLSTDLEQPLVFELPVYFRQPVHLNGTQVTRLVLVFACTPSTVRVPVDHYKLGDTAVAHAVMSSGQSELSLTLTAWPGQDEVRLMVTPVDKISGAGQRLPDLRL